MVTTRAQAVRTAKAYHSYHPSGMCAQFTRVCFEIGPGFGSARLQWFGAKKKHRVSRGSQIPAGVPVYWLGGFGHAAPSIGGGLVRSTDWPRSGNVGTARIDDISRVWGKVLVGWTEDINGVLIPGMPSHDDGEPDIHYDNVIIAVKTTRAIYHGKMLKEAVAKEVGKGHMNLASPILGRNFRTQYIEVQKKFLHAHNRDLKRSAIDGLPGRESLTWLGKRHGFDVV